jgi:hypothetical protein
MGALVFVVVGIWVGSAFGPNALERHLADASLQGHLPLGFALESERGLALDLRYRTDGESASWMAGSQRRRERLVLHAPHYLRGVSLVPVVDMPVDASERYFHALLEAHLRREAADPASALGRQLRRGAVRTMRDVPVAARLDAYVDALASFGSHVLSVANELERKELQRRDRGGVCPLLAGPRPAPLVALWRQMFASGRYSGAYLDARGAVCFSRAILTPEDKRLLTRRVLRVDWSGSPARDFAPRYCTADRLPPRV